MESFFSRYRNPMILGGVLLVQLLGLAVQVKRPVDPKHPDAGSIRLIRLWLVSGISPVEKTISAAGHGTRRAWHDYINLAGLRQENENLRAENARLHLEETRLNEDAAQAHRLQALLDFKEKSALHTIAAQVIGTSGSEQSRVLYIDKGARDGLQPEMPVITPDGIVGKVRDVFRNSAQVLLINDEMSGVGALLERSRLYGVVKGTAPGTLLLDHIMSDEKIEKGDTVVTSGGDRIFPKGLPVGTVDDISPGSDLFLNIRVKPAADLNRLEEVLVITDIGAAQPESTPEEPVKAAYILAQRLPTVEPKPPQPETKKSAEKKPENAKPATTATKQTASQTPELTKNKQLTGEAAATPAAPAAAQARAKPAGTTTPPPPAPQESEPQ